MFENARDQFLISYKFAKFRTHKNRSHYERIRIRWYENSSWVTMVTSTETSEHKKKKKSNGKIEKRTDCRR